MSIRLCLDINFWSTWPYNYIFGVLAGSSVHYLGEVKFEGNIHGSAFKVSRGKMLLNDPCQLEWGLLVAPYYHKIRGNRTKSDGELRASPSKSLLAIERLLMVTSTALRCREQCLFNSPNFWGISERLEKALWWRHREGPFHVQLWEMDRVVQAPSVGFGTEPWSKTDLDFWSLLALKYGLWWWHSTEFGDVKNTTI